jgi:uncharacterized protein YlaI
MNCPECGKKAKFVDNAEIYGKRYGQSYMMYWCKTCDTRVGVHQNDPNRPLGTMAGPELRKWRKKAHDAFDKLWCVPGLNHRQARTFAYQEMSEEFGREMHIGEADIETCKEIIEYCEEKK